MFSLAGVIDAATIPALEKTFDQDVRRQRPLALVRLADVTYINSTGMGLFIKFADRYRASGGELCFSEVSTKVLALFRMLGLLSVLRVYASEAQAVAELKKAPASAAAPPPAADATPPSSAAGPAAPVSFPLTTVCQGCQARLLMPEAGFYRCPTCSTCFQAEAGRPLRIFAADRRAPFEASLTYDAAYLDGLCAILDQIAAGAGLSAPEREGLARACRALVESLIRRANGKGRAFKMLVASDPGECLVGVRADVPVPQGEADSAFDAVRSATDAFEVIPAGTGCFFKMRKRSSAPPKTPHPA